MTMLKKLTIINIKFMKNKKCDGCCEVSSVKFVVGYIDHNLINNVIFIHKVQHNTCVNS
jgi:hypothetical protein